MSDKDTDPMEWGPNRNACEAALSELMKGNPSAVDVARYQAQRTLATVLDGGTTNSQLYREYREGWKDLVGKEEDDSGGAAGVLAAIRDAATAGT